MQIRTALALVLAMSPAHALAVELRCKDTQNSHLLVESLVINEQAKSVTLNLRQGTSPREVLLVTSSEVQFGERVYAFNLPPEPNQAKVTNAFKLFKATGAWRLIDAGLLDVNGTLTLRAIGTSVPIECSKHGA